MFPNVIKGETFFVNLLEQLRIQIPSLGLTLPVLTFTFSIHMNFLEGPGLVIVAGQDTHV